MDSLTQIVLGAAVGEAVLGKKIGNRAMLWGAIAGTIPDLDILANPFMSEIDGLAFHRGITHSLFFAVLGAGLFAYLAHNLYKSGVYTKPWFRVICLILGSIFIGFCGLIAGSIAFGFSGMMGKIISGLTILLIGLYFIYRLWQKYFKVSQQNINIHWRQWYILFFLGFVTHTLLDCFTVYGTQLFAPFSDYRVAWGNISVADPSYTFPFLAFLLLAAFTPRLLFKKRKIYNYLGIAVSSIYMIFTLFNHKHSLAVAEKTIKEEGINSQRFMTSPTILNNILWSATVEADSVFYHGQYSLFDTEQNFKFYPIPKNHHLLRNAKSDDHTINTLKWFSDGYFSVLKRKDGRLQINDMRYATFRADGSQGENDFVFRFVMEQDENGYYHLSDAEGGPPEDQDMGNLFGRLWQRIKGI